MLIGKIHSDGGRTEAHRLAHKRIDVQAATWRTFAKVTLFPMGRAVWKYGRTTR